MHRLGHYQVIGEGTRVSGGGCNGCGAVVAVLRTSCCCCHRFHCCHGCGWCCVEDVLAVTGSHWQSHMCDAYCPCLDNGVLVYIKH